MVVISVITLVPRDRNKRSSELVLTSEMVPVADNVASVMRSNANVRDTEWALLALESMVINPSNKTS